MSDRASNKTVVTSISAISERPKSKDACLVVIYGLDLGKRFPLDRPSFIIGRSETADIQVDQEAISRNHCKIINTGKAILLRDLNSTNGTFVNDRMVEERVLTDGDLIKIGRCIFKFITNDNIESAYHEEIYRLTTIDGLTQIFNKRHFLEALEREFGRAHRYHRELSLIMFDIDHFKRINDTYGHLAGDHVLKQLAHVIKGRIRREDILARYGGEEFSIVLPEIDRHNAVQFGEKVRRIVQETTFVFEGTVIPLTISVGVATLEPGTGEPSTFIKLADEQLYRAKEAGRNCVMG